MLNRQIILVSGLVLAMMASQSAWAQQNAQPDATLDPGGFLPSGAATLHEALITTGTTEFIDSGAANPTTAHPGVGTGHILRFTCKVEGSKGPETCDVTLYDGGQPIYSVSQQPTARGAWETFSFTLLEAEANNISSAGYANLTVHLTAGISNKAGDGDSAQFSWVELELPAPANTSPSVTTNAITGEPTNNQATVGGNVTSDGNDTLTEVGVYYSTSAGFNPPGEGTRLVDPDPPQPVVGNFTLDLTGLSAGTTYYYQAFAANGIGETIASTQLSFTTKDLPVMLATPTVTIDSPTSATLGGTMTSNGFDPSGMVDCGIEWGTSSGGSYTQVSAGVCTENNAFTAPQLVDLTTGQDHFFRSYATNSIGTGYSNERSFRPVDTPTVDAVVGERTETTAFLGGDIIDTGGDTTLFVGIILDLDNDPINGGTDVPMTVADPFSELVGSLTPGTDYWFVAYAENSGGRGYSSVTPFKTLAGAPTMDSTPTVDSIVGDGAVLGGTISAEAVPTWTAAWNGRPFRANRMNPASLSRAPRTTEHASKEVRLR
jgi:hypothetical protein